MGSGDIRLCGGSQQNSADSFEDVGFLGTEIKLQSCDWDYWLGAGALL